MAFPYNSENYFLWMQAIAVNHVDILHDPDRTKRQMVSFGEIFLSSDPFDKIDISTFMEDVKSKIKFPCMLAVGTDWDGDGEGQQTHNIINASFIILDKPDATAADRATGRRAAYTKTERIAQEISGYIKKYFEVNSVLGHLVKMPQGEKIGPVTPGPMYGTKVNFSFVSRYSALCFKQDQFGLLIPVQDTVPSCCTDTPEPDYCDTLLTNLTASQKNCLKVNVSNSDDTLDADIDPGTLYELEDIIITVKDLDGNVIETFVRPAGVNVEVSVDAGGGGPVGLTSELVDYNSEDIDVFSEDEIY